MIWTISSTAHANYLLPSRLGRRLQSDPSEPLENRTN